MKRQSSNKHGHVQRCCMALWSWRFSQHSSSHDWEPGVLFEQTGVRSALSQRRMV